MKAEKFDMEISTEIIKQSTTTKEPVIVVKLEINN